jgi:endo-1,4-beta-xylanase
MVRWLIVVLVVLGLCLWIVGVRVLSGEHARLEAKMKQVKEVIPKWVEAGGDARAIAPLGQALDEALKAGNPVLAEEILDKILAIVQSSPTSPQGGRASQVRVKVYDASGRPIPREQLLPHMAEVMVTGVYPLDTAYNPLPFGVASVEDGIVFLAEPVSTPLLLHFFPRVEGFGQVKVYADNGGKGYVRSAPGVWEIDLPLEATKSRIAKTQAVVQSHPTQVFRKETLDRLAAAQRLLATATGGSTVESSAVYRALNDALWAGEMATLDVSREIIARRGRRAGFRLGCSVNGYRLWGQREKEQFKALFNFATLPHFFLRHYEEVQGTARPEGAEQILKWLAQAGIEAKGHPLVYLIEPNIPPWLRGKAYNTMAEAMRTRVVREVGHFKGRINVWDIINEPHLPNQHYTQEQIVELTRIAAEATKQANPAATRIVNINWPTGDYVVAPPARPLVAKGMAQTPYQYFKALQVAKVDYDIIGIQMYYWGLDMMEISRLLDRFAQFEKPIHITEIGISSAPGVDKRSLFNKQDLSVLLGEWHRPWDEAVQADWLEQFYTIAYSKPAVQAISWWEFSDHEGSGWPFGGLLQKNFTPKKSYARLQNLRKAWGF